VNAHANRRSRRAPAALITLVVLFAMLATPAAHAAPAGELDPTFTFDGRVITSVGNSIDQANAIAVQPDGKILAGGGSLSEQCGLSGCDTHWALLRYQSNGFLDPNFGGGDGIVVSDTGSGSIYDIAVQGDGKIVAVGDGFEGVENDFVVARYLTNGNPDPDFGSGGFVRTDFGLHDAASSVAINSSGTIVVGGSQGLGAPAFNSTFALARYLTTGAPDTTFDGDGKVVTIIGTDTSFANDVALQGGKVVAVGASRDAGGDMVFTTVRYTSAGIPDTTFDGDGIALKGFGTGPDTATSVLIDPAGKIVVAGSAVIGTGFDFAAVRYTTTGPPDTTFDLDGFRTVNIAGNDVAHGLVRQADGALVLAGATGAGESTDFALVRLTSAGAIDPSWGGDGRVTTDFLDSSDSATSLALQPDGKIVAGGAVFDPFISDTDVGLARYLTVGTGDTTVPVSRISRPKNGLNYYQANIKTFTGTATDTDSGVAKVEIALRRHFTNGLCANWNGSVFVSGSCTTPTWRLASGTGSWTYSLPKGLTKSRNTNVAHYVLFSRATDVAGNVETAFVAGRNRNQFEVI
jgi:uncharacterized delta-60 repeat protein